MSTQVTLYANQDGYMYAKTEDYFSNARDASVADVKDISSETMRIGLAYINPPNPGDKYRFYRGYVYFDTSDIPENATIVSAFLSIYLTGNLSIRTGGFDIILQNGQPDYPSATLTLADFNRLYYSGNGGSAHVSDGSSGYITITLNDDVKDSWINKGGTTKFCLRSSLDITPTVPQLYMLADFYTSEKGTAYAPKLVITYAQKPTVTTQEATNVGSTYATGNGTITSLGDSSVTAHGVIWKKGDDPVDLANADGYTDEGASSGGAFTSNITGLDPSSTYYYRAYATNDAGTSYGNSVSFTTSSPPVGFTVTTQDPTDVTDTTATAHGTIVEDNDYTITQHGVIYKEGGDPGTPSDPTTAEGYTQEGSGNEGPFESSLSGLTASSVYFYRAYAQTTDDGGHVAYGGLVILRTGTPESTTIYGDPGDGSLYTYGIWENDGVHVCSVGDWHCTDDTTAEIESSSCGQSGGPWSYPDRDVLLTNESEIELYTNCAEAGAYCYECHCVRAFLYFDTSSLSGKTITSATLKIYVTYSSYTTYTGYDYVSHGQGFKVGHDSTGTYPRESNGSPALEAGDFDKNHYYVFATVSSATMETYGAPGSVNAYIPVSIPTSRINPNGLTKFCIMLYDTGEFGTRYGQTLRFETANGTHKPYLEINYIEPGAVPAYPKINIDNQWRDVDVMLINIGGEWRYVSEVKVNIGDSWKDAA